MGSLQSRWFQLSGREIKVLLVAAGLILCMLSVCEVQHRLGGAEQFRVENAVEKIDRPPRMDINSAAGYELQLLPGIGPKTAMAIIADRKKTGSYKHLEELERVDGIGPKTIERLRPHVMCRPSDSN